MVKVTDKDYYMDGYLKANLDICIKRERKKWDNLLIMDGDEGCGKSTLGIQIGYYVAHTANKPFDHTHVFFDLKEMLKFVSSTRNQVILWDEAALGGMGEDWQVSDQKMLIKILMTARKHGHFLIFIIPKIKKLREYIALDRSIALIRVYSPDRLKRGYFLFYGKKKKQKLYYTEKTNYFSKWVKYSFNGMFTNARDLINEEAYEAAKDKAIENVTAEKEQLGKNEKKWKKRTQDLVTFLVENKLLRPGEICKIVGVTHTNFKTLKHDSDTYV